MTAPRYDDKDWPLFRIVPASAPMSDEEFQGYVQTLDSLPLRGGKYAVLLDARGAASLSAKQRQTLGEHAQVWYERHPGLLVGFAVVMTSAVHRGVFTAIMWIIRAPLPVRAFQALGDAEDWLAAQLRESGARPLAYGE